MAGSTRAKIVMPLVRTKDVQNRWVPVAPCPVIFNDILINSDDSRAAAALESISELAGRTQVLFFTHHTRLAELGARSGAQMIQLGQVAAAAVA